MDAREESLRQRYFEFQAMTEQIKEMQGQLQMLESKSEELSANVQSLESIKGHEGKELLVPVVEGIFIKAENKNKDNVLINIGAGILVEKSIDDAKKALEEKNSELIGYARQLRSELEKVIAATQMLEEELAVLVGEKGKNV